MNVIDEYKNLSVSEIKEKVQEKTLPYAVMMTQIKGDFNFGTVVRNANAFGAKCAYYFGPRKKYDKRGAVGTYHYSNVEFLKNDLNNLKALKSIYPHFVAIDIVPGCSTTIFEYNWKPKTLLLFGEETNGLNQEILDLCEACLHIPQRGSVRSINVGSASAVAMSHIMMALS